MPQALKRSIPWLLCAVLFACCLLLAGAVGHLEVLRRDHTMRITKAEADARTAFGKLYELEERHADEIEAARGAASVELWTAQSA